LALLSQLLERRSDKLDNLEDCRWDRPVATLQVMGHPLSMAFHSYDTHLVVANESDMIR